jgi:accessory gene regulator B
LNRLAGIIANRLVQNGADPELEDVYAYGIECTLSTLLILALLIVAGFILHKPIHMLVFIAAWLPLRMLVGGAHANTHWMCTLISVGLGTISVWLSDYISRIPVAVMIALSICCYVVFFFTAPVVHKNHPISQKRYRKARIIARIYAAVECAVIIVLALIRSPMAAPAFMGFFTTAVLAVIGWLSKDAK